MPPPMQQQRDSNTPMIEPTITPALDELSSAVFVAKFPRVVGTAWNTGTGTGAETGDETGAGSGRDTGFETGCGTGAGTGRGTGIGAGRGRGTGCGATGDGVLSISILNRPKSLLAYP